MAASKESELTFEQHGFEPHRSTQTWLQTQGRVGGGWLAGSVPLAPPCSRQLDSLRGDGSGTTTGSGSGALSVPVSSGGSSSSEAAGLWGPGVQGPGKGSGHCRGLRGGGPRPSGALQSDHSDRPNPESAGRLLVLWMHCCVDMGPGVCLHSVNLHTP